MTHLKSYLKKLDKKDLIDLLLDSTKGRDKRNWSSLLLEKVSHKLSSASKTTDLDPIYAEQYSALAKQVFAIIDEHNRYGGGPDDEYDMVDDLLTKINTLFTKHHLSQDIKTVYIDLLFKYFNWGNSGLTDTIMESIFTVSETVSDWHYVISCLEKGMKDNTSSSSYRLHLILDIYLNKLHDEDSYLKLRQQNLDFSPDYLELIDYYWAKGDKDKSLEIAKLGVSKHHSNNLYEWLFKYYRDTDYKQALGYLEAIFQNYPDHLSYKRLKQYSTPDDWIFLDPTYRDQLKSHSLYQLALVNWDNGEFDQVLSYALTPWQPGEYNSDKETLIIKLIPHFPNELLPLLQSRVTEHVSSRTRDEYRRAVVYAQYVKDILCKHTNQQDDWDQYVEGIRSQYIKLPALLDEFSAL